MEHTVPIAAQAMHASGVAMTMSSPCAFSGDWAASTSSGCPERPAEAGKATNSVDSAPAADAAAEVVSHAAAAADGEGSSAQLPAVKAVVAASDQHVHAPQPATNVAVGVQQQFPKHAKEWQS